MPSWAYRDGSCLKLLALGEQVVISNEAPDIMGAYVPECEKYVGKQGSVKSKDKFQDPRDANRVKDAIIVTVKDPEEENHVLCWGDTAAQHERHPCWRDTKALGAGR